MKTVSLVQVNFPTGPSHINVYYLPYSIGTLWCYASLQPDVRDHLALGEVMWRHAPIDAAADRLSQSDIVCFSTYVWNRHYHYALAQAIKQRRSDCVIMFGGPEPPVSDPEIFRQHPYIDIVVKGEGEVVFASVLSAMVHSELLDQVPGLLINQDGVPRFTGEADRILDLSVIPSAYTSGFFDSMIRDNPDISWTATLETNRGCPYQCTFCDWGSLTYSKVKQFPLERVLAELDWFADHCDGIWCADANFGMFYDRDRQIVERLVAIKQRPSRLNYWYVCWAKNHKKNVIDLISLLHTAPGLMANGLTVSTQSMTPEVLGIIKRKNLRQQALQEIFELTNRHQIPVYTELILGLPGETVTSWKRSLFDVFRAGNHHSIDFVQCQVLQNSELNLVQRQIYDIRTHEWFDTYGPKSGEFEFDVPEETVAVVTSTSTMTYKDLRDLNVWNNFISTMHFFGHAAWTARFLSQRFSITYEEFYGPMYQRFQQHAVFGEMLRIIADIYDEINHYGRVHTQIVPGVHTNLQFIFHLLNMKIAAEGLESDLQCWIQDYIRTEFPVLGEYLEPLLRFQHNVVTTWSRIGQDHAVEQISAYDFYGYLEQGQELERAVQYQFSPRPLCQGLTLDQYVEHIYFRRRQKIGQMQVQVMLDDN